MFFATGTAALFALFTYRKSAKLERAKWLMELYNKFYEHDDLKMVRELLEAPDEAKVLNLVRAEPAAFTDYLNFFEFLGYLCESKQLKQTDMLAMFEYYLGRLEEIPPVAAYINDPAKGFEKLNKLFDAVRICQYLFVYGTLMKGFDSLEKWQKRVNAVLLGRGRVSGKLYDVGDYPGAVAADRNSQWEVLGELYELRTPEAAIKLLDDYEDFFPMHPEKSLYVRTLVPVKMEDGRTVRAWVYWFNGEVDEGKLIPNGDYRSMRSG
jgi:gamma-glutamylcyclotransferase (GGCT)/AIG2-like uncharacterized protein YtfP